MQIIFLFILPSDANKLKYFNISYILNAVYTVSHYNFIITIVLPLLNAEVKKI